MITDTQSLVSATINGHPVRVYDDGYGPLFVHFDSMGATGIVRARTWEDAYSICEDEFFPEAEETVDELQREYGFRREHIRIVLENGLERPVAETDWLNGRLRPGVETVRWETTETPDPEAWTENGLFQEAYGFRPNGPRVGDVQNHGIYAKDLNGDRLESLTPQLAEELGIKLEIQEEN